MAAIAQPAGGKLFTRQSSGLVREVSVVNALFFNTCAFIGGGAGWYPVAYSLAFVPIGTLGFFTSYGWATIIFGVFAVVLGLIFSSLASVMPRSGGDYVFTSRLIPRVGPFLGWLESFTLIGACIAIIMFEIDLVRIGLEVTGRIVGIGTGSPFFTGANDWFPNDVSRFVLGLVVVGLIVAVVVQPTRRFHAIVTWLAIVGLISVAAMFVFGLTVVDGSRFAANLPTYADGATVEGLRQAAIDNGILDEAAPAVNFDPSLFSFVLAVVLLNFIGFQYSAYISGEVRGNVRRGVLIGVLGALAIGVFMNSVYNDAYSTKLGLDGQLGWGVLTWLVSPDLPMGQPNLMPLTAAIALPELWPLWALIQLGGTLFPFLLCPVYVILISRIMLAWSLDRQVPEWFGAVSERLHAPLNAILTVVGILVVLVILQNFPLLPPFLAPPEGRLTLFAFLWLSILLALLTWVMPGVNAFVARYTRPDLVGNAPYSVWLPLLGIVWVLFAGVIYWVAFIDVILKAIAAALAESTQAGFDYLINTGIFFTILVIGAALVIYVVQAWRNRAAGVDTALMYQQIPPD